MDYRPCLLMLLPLVAAGCDTSSRNSRESARAEVIASALPCAEAGPWHVATDETRIYWTDFRSGTVRSISSAGGESTVIASGQQGPCGVAVDGGAVYWTNHDGGTVLAAPKTGGPAVVLASKQDRPASIGIVNQELYWVTGTDNVRRLDLAADRAMSRVPAIVASSRPQAADTFNPPKRSGPTPHCDLCPVYCTRTVCDLNSCRPVREICGWRSCNCTQN
jgi:hypothetical protein